MLEMGRLIDELICSGRIFVTQRHWREGWRQYAICLQVISFTIMLRTIIN